MIKYDYVAIYTGIGNWLAEMDKHGEIGFHMVSWIPWDGNHKIIMERAKDQ